MTSGARLIWMLREQVAAALANVSTALIRVASYLIRRSTIGEAIDGQAKCRWGAIAASLTGGELEQQCLSPAAYQVRWRGVDGVLHEAIDPTSPEDGVLKCCGLHYSLTIEILWQAWRLTREARL